MPALAGLLPITTPLALIAFIVAAAFYAYRVHLLQRRKTIADLPAGDRLPAVEAMLTRFRVDTAGMTNRQKETLVLAQVRAQAQRFLIGAIVVCVLAMVAAVVSIASLPPASPAPPTQSDKRAAYTECLNRARAASPTTDQMIAAAKACEADAR